MSSLFESNALLEALSEHLLLDFGAMQAVSRNVRDAIGPPKNTFLFVKRLNGLSKEEGAMRTQIPRMEALLTPQDADDTLTEEDARECLSCVFKLSEELELAVDLERRCSMSALVTGTKDPLWRKRLSIRLSTGCDIPVAWIVAFANVSLSTTLSYHVSTHNRHELDGSGFNPPQKPGVSYMMTKFWSNTGLSKSEEQFCPFERIIDAYYEHFPPLKLNGCWFWNSIFCNDFDDMLDEDYDDSEWTHPAWNLDAAAVGDMPPRHVAVFGSLVLMVACAGHLELLKYMLDAGASVTALWRSPFWFSPGGIYPVALSFKHEPEAFEDILPQLMHWEAVGEANHLFSKHSPRNVKEQYHLMIGSKRLSGIRAVWAHMVSIEGANQRFVSFLVTDEFREEIETDTAADWLLLHANNHVPDLDERLASPLEYD